MLNSETHLMDSPLKKTPLCFVNAETFKPIFLNTTAQGNQEHQPGNP